MIETEEIKKYLDISKNLQQHFNFYDMHVHPFEVISNDFDYCQCRDNLQVYSRNGGCFSPPKIRDAVSAGENRITRPPDSELKMNIAFMLLKRQYCYTGPGVFKAHMNLCGIHKSLLLPVARPAGDIADQMQCMADMFGSDERFAFATGVPDTVSDNDVDCFITEMISRYDIKAVKFHPNISEIDLASDSGMVRVESILWACRRNHVPLIIHGGKSWLLKNPKTAAYAAIDNLKKLNWAAYGATVIIAHAGFHSSSLDQVETTILPELILMLNACDNVFVDISDLNVNELIIVFRNINAERILFGSDALYNSQWETVVKTMYALSKAKCQIEKTFCRIASINPSTFIFERP